MIRIISEEYYGTGADGRPASYREMAGHSGDVKPVTGLVTGSRFHEVDTGIEFMYEEESGSWYAANTGNGKTSLAGATITLGSAVKYNGSERTKSVSTVKIGSTTLTADTDYTVKDNKATEVGTYTLHVVGKGDYTGVASKEWTLDKGTGSITRSPTSLTLTEGGDAGEVTVTVTGDGDVSVSCNHDEYATASIVETATPGTWTLTVTPVAEGSATVTVSKAETGRYTSATNTVSVTVEAASEEEGDT